MWPLSRVPRQHRLAVRAWLQKSRRRFVDAWLSYDAAQLVACLRRAGIQPGDTVMLHSAFEPFHGFRGNLETLTGAFLAAIGPQGNLLMVSLAYTSSSQEYLRHYKTFDVRRTPSRMGLMSEFFRRRANVLRSLHPTHPILAHGPEAERIVANHESCRYPCGLGTPFEKLAQLDGKIIFFNVSFKFFTFFHHIEHLIQAQLAFPLYEDESFTVPVIDQSGGQTMVTTHVLSAVSARLRPSYFDVFEQQMRRRGLIRSARIGNSRIQITRARDAIDCAREVAAHDERFARAARDVAVN